jgi:tripartite-type tricarboxylate transporter receptor subunit TctC
VLRLPSVKQRLELIGSEPAAPNGPEQLAAFIRSEVAKWKTVTKSKE